MRKTSKWNKAPVDKTPVEEEPRRTVYIVSGLQRTGTSMIMRALEFGGMNVLYDPTRDTLGDRAEAKDYRGEDYYLNPHGFYEGTEDVWVDEDWLETVADRPTKNLIPGVMVVAPPPDVDFKIIMMFRDPDEIEESWVVSHIDPTEFMTVRLDMRYYELFMADAIEFLVEERGAQVLSVHFADVIDNPRKELRKIKRAGWPIEVGKAVIAIDPSLYRIRVKK